MRKKNTCQIDISMEEFDTESMVRRIRYGKRGKENLKAASKG
jgi:hypothetical protein